MVAAMTDLRLAELSVENLAATTVVGFVMGNFDPGHESEALQAGIWRLNVAADLGALDL